jgi:predicted methyltransferase
VVRVEDARDLTAPAHRPRLASPSRGARVAALLVVVAVASSLSTRADPGWLGVTVADAPADGGPGARLGVVALGSPAEHVGLADGDVVRRADAQPIRRAADLVRTVRRRPPGTRVSLAIDRGGARFDVAVALTARPAGYARLFEYERDAWQEPERVLDAMAIGAGAIVVDLGAGGGYFTERLAARVGKSGQVIAVDVDADALRSLARRFPPDDFPHVRVHRGGTTDPQLSSSTSADAALLVDTYHELVDAPRTLHALSLALRPEGRLVVVDRAADDWRPEAHAIPEARVREQAAAAGYREIMRVDLQRQFMLVLTPDR